MANVDLQVSPEVKDKESVTRLRNLLAMYPGILLKLDRTSLTNKEFASYIGLSTDYWYMIRSGKRSFTRKNAKIIEDNLNLQEGELDLNPDEAGTVSELMLDCVAAYTNAVNEKELKFNRTKTREIIERLHSASIKKGEVDFEELSSLLSLAS